MAERCIQVNIIMYIYHALINALSAYMIPVNPDMIFYTHVEHSSTQATHTKHHTKRQTPPTPHHHEQKASMNSNVYNTDLYHTSYMHARTHAHSHARTHAHTHTGFQFGFEKDDRVEQCLRSCGSEVQMWGPKQEKVQKPWVFLDLLLLCGLYDHHGWLVCTVCSEGSWETALKPCSTLLFECFCFFFFYGINKHELCLN